MLKKDIKFEDLEGNEVVETHYFHLTKSDLIELELEQDGGLTAYLHRIAASRNNKEIIAAFKQIIARAYGEQSTDGRHFVKDEERTKAFMSSEAYSVLFIELFSNPDDAADFVKGCLPKSMQGSLQNHPEFSKSVEPAAVIPDTPFTIAQRTEQPAWIRENRDPTPKELRKMTPEQLRDAYLALANKK